jgi:hypothetical protein
VSYSGDDLGLCIIERVVSSVFVVRQWKSRITRWEHYCTEEEEEEEDDTLWRVKFDNASAYEGHIAAGRLTPSPEASSNYQRCL